MSRDRDAPGGARETFGTTGRTLTFGDFRLDRVDGRLLLHDVEKPLRGKSFALLRYLAEHPGRLVTRDELLRAVWPGIAVSPSVVRVSISEVRDALGEDADTPKFLETVGRQGYRFLAGTQGVPIDVGTFVGRQPDLARLHRHLDRCRSRKRETVFVTGEPGMGKTTLLERFADEVRSGKLARVATGQCIELNGPAEPYLPVLDLLGSLCRDDDRGDVVRTLERWAPSWLLQMPGVVDAATTEKLHRRVPAPSRERMLRELADAFDVLGRDTPLVVILEDLHWSDASTVDLLAYLAERNTPARLLLVGSYRPVDLVVQDHPLRAITRHLLARGRATLAPLELLSENDARAFLVRRLGGADMDPRLPVAIHARTDGIPLFLASVVEHLLHVGALERVDGTWRVSAETDDVPHSIRELVIRQTDVLSAEERAAVDAASVVGPSFDAGTVAAACGRTPAEVDGIFVRLAERGQHVCTVGTTSAEGGVVGTYEFLHALHQSVLYQRLAPADRGRLHHRVATYIEAHSESPHLIAAVLASHFERGGDVMRALAHHVTAIDGARARVADREIVAHCRTILSLLDGLPDTPERRRQEMTTSLELAVSLVAIRGLGDSECEPHFMRTRDLALELQLPQVELIARGGLYTLHVMRGDQRRALELSRELKSVTAAFPFPVFTAIGHATVGCSHYMMGDLELARHELVQAHAFATLDLPRVQIDPTIVYRGIGVLVHHQMGDTATAEAWSAEILSRVDALTDPLNAVNAYQLLTQYRAIATDRSQAITLCERTIQLAAELGVPANEAEAKIMKGWLLRDAALVLEGGAMLAALGLRVSEPTQHLALGEIHCERGLIDEAEREVTAGLASAETSGEMRHAAELHRLRAACARRRGRPDAAEAALRQALDVAHAQGSRLFVLRSAADFAELLVELGRREEARALLTPLCSGFVPDGQGPELHRVRALSAAAGPSAATRSPAGPPGISS